MKRIVIIGAGPTGLGAGYRLQELGYTDWVIYERSPHVGGLAASVTDSAGFTYDIGGHVMFSHYPYFDRLVEFAMRYMRANVMEGKGDGIVTYTGQRRTTDRTSPDDRNWVYRRSGQECRRCGTTILMRKQGTQARSTYWCPACQPWIEQQEP